LGLRSLITRADLGFSRLEDAPVPIHVVATDVLSGEAVVLSEGDTGDALVASAAIPGVFAPVEIGGRTLIDGGVVANLPIRQALELGATRVFVLPAFFDGIAPVPSRALDMVQYSTMIATAALARRELERAPRSGDVHVLPLPAHVAPSMFDFDHTPALIDHAYASSAAWLQVPPGSISPQPRRTANQTPRRALWRHRRSTSPAGVSTSDGFQDARDRLPRSVA
jgi:NTE family protein